MATTHGGAVSEAKKSFEIIGAMDEGNLWVSYSAIWREVRIPPGHMGVCQD